ncbi:DUF1971 domain-containing protein [Pelagibius sp.]|uniref:DUF1971 domain-containing protein n=1 Tax=Pelagibius sp. TaxID=1931238 RepID=UPI00260CE2E4|nr:DUF1971 domain-containing protein [Pelagibius sp.]
MNTLPPSVKAYHRTAVFTETTVPKGLLQDHRTKQGVWGVITVLSGRLRYTVPSTGEVRVLEAGRPGIVEPTVAHRVKPLGPVEFFVEFHR